MPLFHPLLASRRIQFCRVCLPFLLNSDGFVWLPHHPRSFTQAMRLWRTPSWPDLAACAVSTGPPSPGHISHELLACLCTKAQSLSQIKQSWWIEPIFLICCSKNVLGEGCRSLVRGGIVPFYRGVPFHPQLSHAVFCRPKRRKVCEG